MSPRQSFLTKRYSNVFYFGRAHVDDVTCPYYVDMRSTFGLRFVSRNDYSLYHEFRRERKPDFAEEESVGLLKALRRVRRD